jgi:hypothetical protein
LHPNICPGGEIGRRTVFRWQHPKGCDGSNPFPGTSLSIYEAFFIPKKRNMNAASKITLQKRVLLGLYQERKLILFVL